MIPIGKFLLPNRRSVTQSTMVEGLPAFVQGRFLTLVPMGQSASVPRPHHSNSRPLNGPARDLLSGFVGKLAMAAIVDLIGLVSRLISSPRMASALQAVLGSNTIFGTPLRPTGLVIVAW